MAEHVGNGRSKCSPVQYGQQTDRDSVWAVEPEAVRLGGARRPSERARRRQARDTRRLRFHARRHVILFLASNPGGTTRLALDEECAAIERELQIAPSRDFDFRSKWAVSVDEVMRCFNELQPTIIHFSGHGGGGAGHGDSHTQAPLRDSARDIVPAAGPGSCPGPGPGPGIYLQDAYVSGRALAQMIAVAAPSARLVVLNACFSDEVARSLHRVVDCVVGMRGAVGDDAARWFSVGFYRALGNCRSVGNAVEQAVASLAARQLPDEHLPVCRPRNGICANQLFLPGPAGR